MNEPLLTVQQVATHLSCSGDTVRRMCATGKLRCLSVGTGKRKTYRIYSDSIEGLRDVHSRPQSTPAKPVFSGTPMLDKYRRMAE